MWKDAKPIRKLWEQAKAEHKTYVDVMKNLHVVDTRMAEYGDWTLYRDSDGNLWEEYESIGD